MAGFPLADPIVGLLITVAILVVLRTAVRDIGRRMMDGVEPETVDLAESSLGAVPGVRDVEQVRMRWVGHGLRVEAGVVVDPRLDVVAAHGIAVAAEHRLRHDVPKLAEVTVYVTPGGKASREQEKVLDHHH